MDTRVSLKQALKSLGFQGGNKHDTELNQWINHEKEVLAETAKQYGIDKLKWVVSGGETGQESIRNGVYNLMDKCDDDDNVIIHDGIRPLVEPAVITDVIAKCNEYGNKRTGIQRVTGWSRKTVWIENPPLLSERIAKAFFYCMETYTQDQ